jgi:hypothetical protein
MVVQCKWPFIGVLKSSSRFFEGRAKLGLLPLVVKLRSRIGSFLLSVHERGSLAAAIAYHFEMQAEDALALASLECRANLSLEVIRGTLQACSGQTSDFD